MDHQLQQLFDFGLEGKRLFLFGGSGHLKLRYDSIC
jgi:hypothetical protein